MKKINLFIVSLLIFSFVQAQQKFGNYPCGTLNVNIMIMPFGMENAIKIGTISKSGDINFDFPKEINSISNDDKENMSSKL